MTRVKLNVRQKGLASAAIGLSSLAWLTACGPDRSQGPAGSPTSAIASSPATAVSTSSRTPSATSSQNPAADRRRARSIVLRTGDLEGYTGSAYTPDPSAEADDATLSACLGRPPASKLLTAKAFSPQLSKGDARQILGSVSFVMSASVARADLAALRSSVAPACMASLLKAELTRSGATSPRVTATRLPFPVAGLDGVAIRLSATVSVQGQDLTEIVDYAAMIAGRAEIDASFQDVNSSVPLSDRRAALAAMAHRAGVG